MGVPVTALSSGDLDAIAHHDATADDLRALWRWRTESPEWAATCARRDRWGWRLLLAVRDGRGVERLRSARLWVREHPPPEEAPPPFRLVLDAAPREITEEDEAIAAEFDRLVAEAQHARRA